MQSLAQQPGFLPHLLDGLRLCFRLEFGRSSTARLVIQSIEVCFFPPVEPLADAVAIHFVNIGDLVN